jgi:hypothetical protein
VEKYLEKKMRVSDKQREREKIIEEASYKNGTIDLR